jgi:dTDP-glucose 4,6-dehydratase
MRWLFFGGNGWIGNQLRDYITTSQEGDEIVLATCRADDMANVTLEIQEHSPDVVFSCIGRTHGGAHSTIDYLEEPGKLNDNIRDNLFGPMVLAQACKNLGCYFVYIGTGCIFEYEQHKPAFTETSEPNFFGSSYSIVKGFTDRMFHWDNFKNTVLNLRIRMPITGTPGPRNFITKICSYDKVVDIQNSMTVLDTLWPHVTALVAKRHVGTLNFTNPGTISHNEILDMYKEIVNPNFTYKNFTLEEQNKILKSKRSNNALDTTELLKVCPTVPDIQTAVRRALEQYAENMKYIPKTVLVTGGCGFIGSHMVTYLFNKYPNYNIVNVDSLTYSGNLRNIAEHISNSKRYTFYNSDIVDQNKISEIYRKHSVDTIMHFAAETHVDRSFENSLEFTKTNVLGTHVLLQSALACGPMIKRFMHVSTDEVYGDVDYTKQVLETNHLNPTNPYAASKVGAEFMVKSYLTSFKLPCIITRCNNVYGPNQYPEKLIPKFALQTMQEKALTIHGKGESQRSFVYIDDVVRAFDLILHAGKVGEIYNVGVDREISVMEVATNIQSFFKQRNVDVKDLEFVADRKFNDQRYYINYQKLKRLGWKPIVEFTHGLNLTLEWYIENSDYWANDVLDEALLSQS